MGDLGAITDAAPPALVSVVMPGTVIAKRYRLVERLGAGGAGTVWRARDLELDADVALKLLAEARSDGVIERWRREVATARRIAHRNVCRVHDLGEHDGIRFVTMELIQGHGLRALLRDGIAPAAARELLAQIVAGAAAIHAAGVVHRDLKPDNIVVDGAGRAVIVDFGLAREPSAAAHDAMAAGSPVSATVTQHGTVVGTPAYMSPEQAAGRAVDPRSDVWALGLIAHELVTGALPGIEQPRGDASTADANRPPRGAAPTADAGEPPRGDAPTADAGEPPRPAGPTSWEIVAAIDRRAPGLGAIVARCLAEDPAYRFPDAIALAEAIARRRRRLSALGRGVVAVALAAASITAFAVHPCGGRRPRHDGPLTQTQLIAPGPAGQPDSVAIAPDGRRLAYTMHHRVYMRAIDGGEPVELPGPPVTTAWAYGFLTGGAIAVLGAQPDGRWAVWRVAQGAAPQPLHDDSRRMVLATSPDGARLAIGVAERGVLVVDAETREERRLVPAARGETISGITWSPDGRSIAFARAGSDASEDSIEIATVADGTTRVVKRGALGHWIDQTLVWPELDRLLYTAELDTGSTLRELDLATGADRERTRWPGENIISGSYGTGVLLVHRGAVRYSVWTARLDERGHPFAWARASAAEIAGRTSGWTSDGRVVYAERASGGLGAVIQRPGEPAVRVPGAPDGARPETLDGDAVIVRKPVAEGRIAIARVAAGAVTDLDAVAGDSAGNSLVRCAGDRAPPCVLEKLQAGRVTWTEIDPVTGAAGARRHDAPPSGRFGRNAALSPDGNTLAIVDGGDAVTFVERGGAARTVSVGRAAELYSASFAHDGRSVLVTAIGHRGYIFSLIRVGLDGAIDDELDNQWNHWYYRATESHDGTMLAADTQEFHLAIWRIDGI